MPPAKIVITRHGQTESNRDDLIMGRSDARLTRQGIETVRDLSRVIAAEGVRYIISSTLGRAALTAAIHSEQLGVPVSFSEAVAELSCGIWEGRPREQVVAGSGPIRGTWRFRPPGGESYLDGEARVSSLVRDILGMTDRRAVLLVGHAAVNRVLMKLLLDLDPDEAMTIRFPHDAIHVVEHARDVRYASISGMCGDGILKEPK
ncbi:MAG: histidine phosphatase family protein [Desulfomonilaceae bacterium]|nr:histidine phosphatase family protein [Desulfomonilaceae bacterium]